MKVLLIDDHPLVLSALESVVREGGEDITVVGVDRPADAFKLLQRESDFDLALLDAPLAEEGGFDDLAALRRRHPGLPVVVLCEGERAADVIRVVDMGAMGYVSRGSGLGDLRTALAMVMAGGIYVPPALLGLVRRGDAAEGGDTVPSVMRPGGDGDGGAAAEVRDAGARAEPPAGLDPVAEAAAAAEAAALVRRVAGPAAPPHAAEPPPSDPPATLPLLRQRPPGMEGLGLTPRQADVLALLLRGLPNKLIARELHLSVDTVKDHVAAVLRALGVTSRTQAVLAVSQMTLSHSLPGWGPQER